MSLNGPQSRIRFTRSEIGTRWSKLEKAMLDDESPGRVQGSLTLDKAVTERSG